MPSTNPTTILKDAIFGIGSGARDTLQCLFFHGPTWDGNIPCKTGRAELVEKGYAERGKGFTWLTRAGIEFAIDSMAMDDAKDRWERRKAGH